MEHIVVVMMENRSFDHYLGWLPGADGNERGRLYRDRNGDLHTTFRLAPDYRGCGYADPDHSFHGERLAYHGGACDGWLFADTGPSFALGYYTDRDLHFFGRAARDWTVCDRYFSAIMAPTLPNRLYAHAAQTDRIDSAPQPTAMATIWDLLAASGVVGRYYYADVPFLALWGEKYRSISRRIDAFFDDLSDGQLARVSFIDPRFVQDDDGEAETDHPFADIRYGQLLLNRIYDAVVKSAAWPATLLVITYDEWGGFVDHVAPPQRPVPPADRRAGASDGLLGFRVPCILISPFARRGHVDHGTYDHTSLLRLIEWRWHLPPLTIRDATAGNLAEALDFRRPSSTARSYTVPPGPFPPACPHGHGDAVRPPLWWPSPTFPFADVSAPRAALAPAPPVVGEAVGAGFDVAADPLSWAQRPGLGFGAGLPREREPESRADEWAPLRALARAHGWSV